MQSLDTEPSREATEQDKEQRKAEIQAFALGLLETRKEAIEGRVASGVERRWREDQEAFDVWTKRPGTRA